MHHIKSSRNQFFSFLSWDTIFIPLWLILPQGIPLSAIVDTTHIECKTSNLYLNTQWMEKSLEGMYTLFLESNYIAFTRMLGTKRNDKQRIILTLFVLHNIMDIKTG